MLPTIAIIGRPNVGKSTLFNVLTQSRDALVADEAGLTRDRQLGRGRLETQEYFVFDTGGLFNDQSDAMADLVTQQALQAVKEADCVLFVVDGKAGLMPADEFIMRQLRTFDTKVHLVINKTENLDELSASNEFYRLGLDKIHAISSAHRQGIESMMESVLAEIVAPVEVPEDEPETSDDIPTIKVAIVGRPNVGKSTLVNRMLGEDRVITFDQPGTTRDSIAIPFERDGQPYILIDTAGIRRRARVYEMIEKFSIIKSLQSIENAHVILMLMDAREGMTDQDASLLGAILDSGRGLIIAVNKWDGLRTEERELVKTNLDRKLHFLDFATIHFISALHGSGVGNLFDSIKKAYHAANSQIQTSQLNDLLQELLIANPPPAIRGRRIKLRYIHQSGYNPPRFMIHGNQVDELPESYKRYLINHIREKFKLQGTPVRLEFKQGENPFEGRKNTLTPHQVKKRRRLMKHVKRS